ncbi:hypothetical protein RRG08_010863 [Elysia crispata]|uniref:Uncharacterized protein n=1 Tax=Elysia crispata TaxID=231223 RepID=A0AAE0XST9_9GAST|nr:hypothetical protein RRG08_010863 [Elysia crispata]
MEYSRDENSVEHLVTNIRENQHLTSDLRPVSGEFMPDEEFISSAIQTHREKNKIEQERNSNSRKVGSYCSLTTLYMKNLMLDVALLNVALLDVALLDLYPPAPLSEMLLVLH